MKAKRLFALILAILIGVGLWAGVPALSASDQFSDASAEYADILIVLKDAGVVQGIGGDVFGGEGALTRAQLSSFLTSVFNLYIVSDVSFSDVPDDSWYAGPVNKAVTAGYLSAKNDTEFCPNDSVSRGELFELVEQVVKGDNTFRPDPKYIAPLISGMSEPVTRYQTAAVFYEIYNHMTSPKAMPDKMVVAYYGNWQVYGKLAPANIPWNMITHLNHAFLTVSDTTPSDDTFAWGATELYQVAFTDSWADIWMDSGAGDAWSQPEEGMLGGTFRVYELMHRIYPNVDIMLSVGGWTRGQMFSAMASSSEKRKVFIDSVINMLDTLPWVGGIDIDWEYPGTSRDPVADAIDDPADQGAGLNSDVSKDSENFTLLLTELRTAMDLAGYSDKLLTICEAADYESTNANQDLNAIAKIVDFVNVMTYDYSGPYSETTQHHAAVYDNEYGNFSVDSAIKGYLQHFRPGQLNVGVASYSRGWAGVEPDENGNVLGQTAGARAPAKDSGHPDAAQDSRYYRGSGNAGSGKYEASEEWSEGKHKATDYPEVIGQWYGLYPSGNFDYPTLLQMKATTERYRYYYDEIAQAPYLYDIVDKVFLSFEDARSAKAKVDYVWKNDLGGLIFWEVSTDDIANGFPLTSIMYTGMSAK